MMWVPACSVVGSWKIKLILQKKGELLCFRIVFLCRMNSTEREFAIAHSAEPRSSKSRPKSTGAEVAEAASFKIR